MPETDFIRLRDLVLVTRIGVPDEERRVPQRLALDLDLVPIRSWQGSGDDLSSTIDYSAVALRIRELASAGERQLIETLAEEIATFLLNQYPLQSVRLELKKFILPDCGAVSVCITRSK